MQVGLYREANKHRAASPLESGAKRGRLDATGYQSQSSELVSQSTEFDTNTLSTFSSLPSIASTECYSLQINDFLPFPINETRDSGCSNMTSQWPFGNWSEAVTSTDPWCAELATMSPGIGMVRDLAPPDTFHIYPPIQSYQLSLRDSKPADFLAIRRTQGK